MLAIVFSLVFLVSSTPNFSDILTHSTAMYSPVDYRKNNLAKLIEKNNSPDVSTTSSHLEFDNQRTDHFHPFLPLRLYRFVQG